MQQYSNSLFRQFPSIVTGNAAVGVSVYVYERDTTNLVTLYADDDVGGATLPNPLTTNNIAFYSFYAPNGKYTLHFSSSQYPDLNIELIDSIELVNAFNSAIDATGYILIDNGFSAGYTVTQRNEALLFDGIYYVWKGALNKTVPAAASPATTGGIGNGAWQAVLDNALRQQLLDGTAVVGGAKASDLAKATINVPNLKALAAIPLAERRTDVIYHPMEFDEGTGIGGHDVRWSAAQPWSSAQIGLYWPDAALNGYTSGNKATLYADYGSGTGAWVRVDKPQYTLQEFGGINDYDRVLKTGTDNAIALNVAELTCERLAKSLLFAGDFGVASATVARRIKRCGIMPATSGLFALADNHRIYDWDPLLTAGETEFSHMIVRGYAEQNTTQGGDNTVLVEVSAFDKATFNNVEACWGRQMALKSRAYHSVARNCHVHHMLRDGINFTDSVIREVRNSRFEFIADDAIAMHLPPSTTLDAFIRRESIVVNNTLLNCYGIKVLSNTATITGNRGQMIFGYGVNVGLDVAFGEGAIDKKLLSIADNNFENVINLSKIGGGNIGAGIWLQLLQVADTDGVVPGEVLPSGDFKDDLPYLNQFGTTEPHLGGKAIVVARNNIAQTWTGGTNIADYGLGQAWTTSGFQNVALTGTLGKDGNTVFGHRFDTSLNNALLKIGSVYGCTSIIRFQSVRRVSNVSIHMGDSSRISASGISFSFASGVTRLDCVNTSIDGGSVDLDPLHEYTIRNSNGSWNDLGSLVGAFIESNQVYGVVVSNVSFRNVKRILQGTTNILVKDCNYYFEPNKGIGLTSNQSGNNCIYTLSDPTLPNYGQILQGAWSSSALPTSGYYFKGQKVNFDLTGSAIAGLDGPAFGLTVVENGDFTTTDDWTLNAATVAITGGALVFTAAGSSDQASQLWSAESASGKTYEAVIAVSGYSSGSLRVSLEGAGGPTISANGTYTFDITAAISTPRIFIRSLSAGTTLQVDSISIRRKGVPVDKFVRLTDGNSHVLSQDWAVCPLVY